MGWIILAVIGLFIGYQYLRLHAKHQATKREAFIDSYVFPEKLSQSLKAKYPHLSDRDINEIFKALRDYFHICNMAGKRMVSMPSQVVDVAWHELILFTLRYQLFCQKAFNRFLHHTPAEAMTNPTSAQAGIKRAWRLACVREGINPENPDVLPLLFAIDSKLGISDGFNYKLRCNPSNSNSSDYCASHIGCSSCSGSSCSSDSSGCSSGCGGGD